MTFKEHLAECCKTVATWPRWKRGVLFPAEDVYACEYRATCWRECGAKMQHYKRHCEPCPFRPHAKCEKVD